MTLLALCIMSSVSLPQAAVQEQAQLQSPNHHLAEQHFSAASVRRNKSDDEASLNVSPTSGDVSPPTGGLYLGRNIVLISYISFAYKLTNLQLQSVVSQAPWTADERYNIEARAEGNPSTEDYRLMMQALLRERFHLAMHSEIRQVPVYAIVPANPKRFGKQLRMHSANDPFCSHRPDIAKAADQTRVQDQDGFPIFCGDLVSMPSISPGRITMGGRDVSISLMASTLAGVGNVGRPLLDQTNFSGNIDFVLEWGATAANIPYGEEFHPDETAPTFISALKEQLGLKLRPQQGPVTFFKVDHIERSEEN